MGPPAHLAREVENHPESLYGGTADGGGGLSGEQKTSDLPG